ncbi:diguanylate cyclase with PAS/PAC sensor [Gluconacetobacter diazotrophicus PA1 5]|uniref:diguanylate cyclase n=2 Tax=Gluconacetobacter diazotrophicus TaxID=33996 RepID=A9HIT0_GLUDA|nr:sensor domain-containing diguanylate cyclase [Gluconacetobacter diazotrophicus]ACI49894.1 diguanylate cyclase with PAS/PAC sensor [Gluconacetobacter diazotrophicus PA1 5]MBB2156445.1 diguanylate cyclase [Gluconacetobacter diazotrophicus]TWB05938.1 PAS domain S-box-containing protein/diguanylate cyclase (GGDEF)-like protein [Gluconacetobacter diazotrophicus]CAP55810.1 putative signalling protein, GGDEF family [Gluconacetobacter diazotrophicus PA1 5]
MTGVFFIRNTLSTLLFCVIWSICALASVTWTRHGGSVSMIWPANAILVMAILRMPAFDHRIYPPLLFVLSSLVNLLDGRGWTTSVGFSVANTVEVMMAAVLVHRISPVSGFFEQVDWAFRFAIAIFVSVACSSVIAGGALFLGEGRDWLGGSAIWMMAHLPGLLITVPMLLALMPDGEGREIRRNAPRRLTVLGLMVLVACMSVVVFGQSRFPLQFLLLPPLLLATFHLYAKGAAMSVAIITMIGSFFMFTGAGAVTMLHGPAALKVYVFQLDLATIFFCALPLGAVLTQRDQKASLAQQRLQDFHHLADRVGDVLFRVDDAGCWSYLNPAYEQMSGISVDKRLGQPMLDAVVIEDRAALAQAQAELQSGSRDDLRQVVSIYRRDGTVRHVEILAHRLGEGEGFGGLIRDVTDQLTLDAHNRQIAAAYEQAANTDELTGLPNRRAFFQVLDGQMAAASSVVAAAMLDLDHFKSINDKYGHPIGDIVLRRVATVVRATLRDTDMVARIGGEEFAVLITSESRDRAISLIRRVVRAVSAESIDLPTGVRLQVTISAGIACREAGEDRNALMSRADQALYVAKRTGRNRLTIADASTAATQAATP